jgi:succinyl-CoA synthetase beta subunit
MSANASSPWSWDGGELCLLLGRGGGVDVEDTTDRDTGSIVALAVDPIDGPEDSVIRGGLAGLGIPHAFHDAYCAVAHALFELARESDARLVEINPLVELADDRLMALDARIVIDTDALARHPEFALPEDSAAPLSVGDLKFKRNPDPGGTIGLIGLGGGLNCHADGLDRQPRRKGRDFGRCRSRDRIRTIGRGLPSRVSNLRRRCVHRAILVNIITCGYRLDDIVAALIEALRDRPRHRTKPVILHLRGNSMARTPDLLASNGYANSPSIAAAVAAVIDAGRH